jgi:hypothetical protein
VTLYHYYQASQIEIACPKLAFPSPCFRQGLSMSNALPMLVPTRCQLERRGEQRGCSSTIPVRQSPRAAHRCLDEQSREPDQFRSMGLRSDPNDPDSIVFVIVIVIIVINASQELRCTGCLLLKKGLRQWERPFPRTLLPI